MLGRLKDHFSRHKRIVVEDANEGDVQHIAAIHGEAFSIGWTDGDIARMIASEACSCLVARMQGAAGKPPIAFIIIRTAADESEIITVATRKSVRRTGAASELLAAAIRKLQADRIQKLFLEVDESNEVAISLYHRSGFKQVGERKGYYSSNTNSSNDNTTALVMQLDLG